MCILLCLACCLSQGFIVDELHRACPASPPCSCSGQVIRCDSKGLVTIPSFTAVRASYFYLNLSGNAISRVEMSAFQNLSSTGVSVLNLQHNNIVYIDNGALNGLTSSNIVFDMAYNRLSTFPSRLTNANQISELQLSGNLLTSIPIGLQKLMKVKTLDLSNNKITSIGSHDLDHLHGVTTFRVRMNPLSSVSRHAFTAMEDLRHLDLQATKLTSFDNDDYLPELIEVNLESTNIACDCQFKWVIERRGFTEINFFGLCANKRMTIKQYIAKDLQKCQHS